MQQAFVRWKSNLPKVHHWDAPMPSWDIFPLRSNSCLECICCQQRFRCRAMLCWQDRSKRLEIRPNTSGQSVDAISVCGHVTDGLGSPFKVRKIALCLTLSRTIFHRLSNSYWVIGYRNMALHRNQCGWTDPSTGWIISLVFERNLSKDGDPLASFV